jgi:allantoinase
MRAGDPSGWRGPGLTETWETPDLLLEAGYEYVCDWVLDDQPVLLKTRLGSSIVSVPYTQERNDAAMMLRLGRTRLRHHRREHERVLRDRFRRR